MPTHTHAYKQTASAAIVWLVLRASAADVLGPGLCAASTVEAGCTQ